MSKKVNIILEGMYKDKNICISSNKKNLDTSGMGWNFTKNNIISYQVLDENSKDSSEYSFWKGTLGVALFGGVGAVAGIGGKNKSYKEYLISIEWKNGEKSLILLDDEYYKVFVSSMF